MLKQSKMLVCNICTELQKVFKYACLAKMQHIYTRTQRISSLCTLLLILRYLPCVRHVSLCKKSRGICIRSYRYQNESRTFKYHETECLCRLYSIQTIKIQSWTKFWECPILRPITQACLASE